MRDLQTTRTRTEFYPYYESVSYPSGAVTDSSLSIIFDDTDFPGFYAKQRRGELILNDMKRSEDEIINSVVSYSGAWHNGVESGETTISDHETQTFTSENLLLSNLGQPPASQLNIDSLVNLALTSMLENAKDSEAMALVTIAEAQKTGRWAHSFMKRASKLVFATARLKRKTAKGLLSPKKSAKKWLEYRYAIRPLLYEGQQLVEAFNNIGAPKRTSFYGFESDSYESFDAPISTVFPSGIIFGKGHYNKTLFHHETAQVRAGCYVEWPQDRKSVSDAFGMNQVLTSAWELVPYSFIIDWFIDIGGYLAAWTPSTLKMTGSFATVDHILEYGSAGSSFSPDNDRYDWNYSCAVGGVKYSRSIRTRTRYANPQLSLLPTVNVKLNLAKITDLVSLVVQNWGGHSAHSSRYLRY